MNRWLRSGWSWLWPWRWSGLVMIGLWIGVMAELHRNKDGARNKDDLEELFPWAVKAKPSLGSQWMGVYLKGKKLGYVVTYTRKEAKGYEITQLSRLVLRLFGSRQKVKVHSIVHVDTRFHLRRFSFRLRSSLSEFRAEGHVFGDTLHIELKTAGTRRRLRKKYRPALLAPVLRPYIASRKPKPGTKIRTHLFDPQSLSYIPVIIEVVGYETLKLGDKTFRALKLEQLYRGVKMRAWLDDKGRTLKEQSATGMTLLREDPKEAPKGIYQGFDLIRATRIQLNGRITTPKTRKVLHLHLENVNLASFPALWSRRQILQGTKLSIRKESIASLPRLPFPSTPIPFLRRKAPPRRQTLRRKAPPRRKMSQTSSKPSSRPTASSRPTSQPSPRLAKAPAKRTPPPVKAQSRRKPAPRTLARHQTHKKHRKPTRRTTPTKRHPRKRTSYSDWMARRAFYKVLEKALSATPLVQSDDAKIRKQAQTITRHSKDRIQALQALHQWVYQNIRKKSVIGIPSALETLKTKVGDCNEHATLFAALARAARIPCQIVSGIAYTRNNFFYHAWNECYVGKHQWLTLDATWGQLPTDVTHIAFVRGGLDKQVVLLQLLGQLRVRLLP